MPDSGRQKTLRKPNETEWPFGYRVAGPTIREKVGAVLSGPGVRLLSLSSGDYSLAGK
jgi:hypothetical protein